MVPGMEMLPALRIFRLQGAGASQDIGENAGRLVGGMLHHENRRRDIGKPPTSF
ncbi:MAG: hypothetical protein U0411_14580 [Thermodesulfovibrionales bacterium]